MPSSEPMISSALDPPRRPGAGGRARTGAWCSGTWPTARSSPSCRSAGLGVMFEPSGDLITSGDARRAAVADPLDPGRGEFRIGPPRRLPLPASACGIAQDRTGRIVAVADHDYAYVATPGADLPRRPAGRLPPRRRQPGRAMAGDRQPSDGAPVWRIRDGTGRGAEVAGRVEVASARMGNG